MNFTTDDVLPSDTETLEIIEILNSIELPEHAINSVDPLIETIVTGVYIGLWKCTNNVLGTFYEINADFLVENVWLEDGPTRGDTNRNIYRRTLDDAMTEYGNLIERYRDG